MTKQSLLEKYAPQSLSDILGQPWITDQLETFAADPYPCAFLFEGETGTGKTSAALLLAKAIGVDVDQAEFGGLHQIAAGEQTGATVREMMKSMHFRPFSGSGWKVLIVNEADDMTTNAMFSWLDALENLPPKVVIIFTTNTSKKMQARFRDRCETITFTGAAMLLMPFMQELTDRIWAEEGCEGTPPEVSELHVGDEGGKVSFRRLLQKLTPLVRGAQKNKSSLRKLPALAV